MWKLSNLTSGFISESFRFLQKLLELFTPTSFFFAILDKVGEVENAHWKSSDIMIISH